MHSVKSADTEYQARALGWSHGMQGNRNVFVHAQGNAVRAAGQLACQQAADQAHVRRRKRGKDVVAKGFHREQQVPSAIPPVQ
jgi:hypothetical protein